MQDRDVLPLRTLEFAEDFLNLLVTFLALEVHFNDQDRILLVIKQGRMKRPKVPEMLHYNGKLSHNLTHLCCHGAPQLIDDVPQQHVFSSEKPEPNREIYRRLNLTNRPRENKMSIGIVGEEESLSTLASFHNLILHFS